MPGIAKEILPPFLYKKLTQTKYSAVERFSSYEEALARCSADAYENQELVEVIRKKTALYADKLAAAETFEADFRSSILLSGILAAAKGKSSLRVLDFGGACGAHYFEMKKALGDKIKLQWVVVETPAMVEQGKLLEDEGLKFTSELWKGVAHLGEVDLLHSSGTLQCVDDPLEVLQKLIHIKAPYCLLNRLGFTLRSQPAIVIHKSKLSWNGVGDLPAGYTDKWLSYPFQFIPHQAFESTIKSHYKIQLTFVEESGIFPVGDEPLIGRAYLLKRHS
jgi:putative methyltransferase (TIGR04325 family)